jgi:hypothetical protein
MLISARVIADSINPDGDRLTTVEAVFNRWILAELNTHRMLSRNSASSRAIPVARVLKQVWREPAYPVHWGKNQAGMQSKSELGGLRLWLAKRLFFWARVPALVLVWLLSKVGLHKQVANRILEPWVWHTAIISSTTWHNFFKLRAHPDAQPEFKELAYKMNQAINCSEPRRLEWGEWHLPYADGLDVKTASGAAVLPSMVKVSAACCARVSYVRQNDRKSIEEDVTLSDRLGANGHFSPLEHPARAERGQWGNFRGWKQARKFYANESGEPKQKCLCENDLYTSGCPTHGHS